MEIESNQNNKNYLLYYTQYHPYLESNIKNGGNIENESLELNEDENDNNNNIINGRWSQKEHLLFIKGCLLYGNNWKEVQNYIQTRSCSQIRSHSQKYFNKLNKKYENKEINKKITEEEIKKLVNKTKLNNKDMENAEMHILTLFKTSKEKSKENIKDEEIKENDNNLKKIKNNKKMKTQKKERIFEITKTPKELKIKKNILLQERLESNNENENEKENEDMNNISEEEYEEDNYQTEKKIFKKDILAGKEDTEIISQKEEFINKCLDSKDPKDLVKLLTYFGNDVNFEVTDINLLKKYQCYLGLDLDNDEENNDENSKNKSEEGNNNMNNNNINNNTGNAFYPYLITPSGTGFQFNPLYNPKIVLNPQIITQSYIIKTNNSINI